MGSKDPKVNAESRSILSKCYDNFFDEMQIRLNF